MCTRIYGIFCSICFGSTGLDSIFLEYLDQRKLVAVYLLGGITGSIVYILSFNIFPAFTGIVADSVAIGASASVMAIVIAIAAYVPDYTVQLFLFGRVKIKYMALAIFVLTSVMDFSVNAGGKLAHIGGALFGYLYTLNLRQGRDIGKSFSRADGFPGNNIQTSQETQGNP